MASASGSDRLRFLLACLRADCSSTTEVASGSRICFAESARRVCRSAEGWRNVHGVDRTDVRSCFFTGATVVAASDVFFRFAIFVFDCRRDVGRFALFAERRELLDWQVAMKNCREPSANQHC